MKFRYRQYVSLIITIEVCVTLNACALFSNNKPSVDELPLIDQRHYFSKRIFLDSEYEISTLELTSNYSWINELEAPDQSSAEDEAVQSAYTLLLHDQVSQAKNLLLRILAREQNQPAAKTLLASIDEESDVNNARGESIRVAVGDSWQSLAQKYYGSPLRFYNLVRLNKSKAAIALKPGQLIKVPEHSLALDNKPASALRRLTPVRLNQSKPTQKPRIPLTHPLDLDISGQ